MRAVTGARAGWLPRMLQRLLDDGRAAALPAGGRGNAAALVMDVTGFTALTERLAARGPAGAERLTELLNARFGAIIDTVARHGGDITHFAGDAIAAVWRADDDPYREPVLERAAACARAVQALPAMAEPGEPPLLVRAGIAEGEMWWALLGGGEDRLFVAGGAALAAAADAAAAAAPGAVGRGAAARAAGAVTTRAPGDRASPDAALFLPRAIRAHLGQPERWLAEFRRVTVAFAAFGDREFAAPERLAAAQRAVRGAQGAVARWDGAVHQLVADGPGAVMVAAWGLPGNTHEDDARRGVEGALAMERALAQAGMPAAVGVATGKVFCGVRGSAVRREWAMLGDTMNLAARLMRAAGSGVLCDAETTRAAGARVRMTAQAPVALKGKARPVEVFRPSSAAAGAAPAAAPGRALDATRTVGRAAELARIDAALARLAEGRGGVLVLEGEAGIGKSQLLAAAAARATARGVRVLRGDADAVESATAYFVWRGVMAQLFPPAAGATAGERVLAALADAPALRARAPLLNDIAALEIPESEETARMESQGRADALRDLVAALLRRAGARERVMVMLDDAHWFDSASWALAAAAARRAPEVLFVIATRPLGAPLPAAYQQMMAGGAERVVVPPLAASDAGALVCARLGVSALPPAAAALIMEKSQGNPFFAEQLALALRDGGQLVVEGRGCRMAGGADALRAVRLPDTVQGVITGRIDRLLAPEQLTLKVASVIGRSFPFRTLRDVHPAEGERGRLRGQLDHLTALDLTRLEAPEPALTHLFTHVITQQVAYDLLSFAQRRELHRAIARWYEARHAADLSPHLALLAHHWGNAEEYATAVGYLERAAAQALERYANEEVLRFIGDARALAAKGGLDVGEARRARWEWSEGEALLKLARYAESRAHFLAALRLLGHPVPEGRLALLGRLAAESARQAWRRALRRAPRARDAEERAALLLASHVHQRLAEVGYWSHDILTLTHSAVASVNLAEPAGTTRELQMADHVLGFVAGLAGSRRLFERYRRRSAEVGAHVEHVETAAFGAQLDAIYFNGTGEWASLHEAAKRAGAGFERIGDRFRQQTCVVLRGWGHLHEGDAAAARARFEEAYAMVRAEGATQVQVWSVAGLMAVELHETGRAPAERIAALESLLAQGVDHSDAIMCHGLLVEAHAAAGDLAAARAHADAATPLIDKFPPASFHTLLGNHAVAMRRIADHEWERTGASGRAARHALRGLGAFARSCRIGRPRAWLARGMLQRAAGRRRLARRSFRRALAEAERLGMRIDAELARRALAE
ncbi:MAG TPA: AAA family ATPase [Gemmatimonadaceae bacterium]|nr:AAA family ATPase [Gemmatimonadaceae bacterium]